MNRNNNCVLIGLPKSGKSTFIAALWHVVESGELASSLVINSLPNERSYLNELRNQWLLCADIDRTKVDVIKKISLEIGAVNSTKYIEFNFPDVSGEMYDLQFETRKIPEEFAGMLDTSNSVIVFINPDLLKKPILISDVNNIRFEEGEAEEIKSWEFSDTPTQVVIVDLLQMIQLRLKRSLKIGLVVSAWDKIINTPDLAYSTQSPEEWLSAEMPLLKQFLYANSDIYSYRFFGVSAQGGDYGSDVEELNNYLYPSQRIIVQEGSNRNNDITLPIRWLIDEQ